MTRQARAARTKHLRTVRQVLAALEHLARTRPDVQPSRRELAKAAGISVSATQHALRTLRDAYGYVRFADHYERNLRLVRPIY